MTAASGKSECEIIISRTFNAPRELVFKAWTDPTLFVHWWGPFPTTNPVCEIDLRPGGAFRWVMRSLRQRLPRIRLWSRSVPIALAVER